ncbi:hypothetical protein HUU59_11090 [bacterium]|nr:hypothetical protein [bacterium]
MTKHEAITQLVPQSSNAASEALLWLAVTAVAAFAIYFCFGYAICWIEDKMLKHRIKREAL